MRLKISSLASMRVTMVFMNVLVEDEPEVLEVVLLGLGGERRVVDPGLLELVEQELVGVGRA